MTTIQSCTLVGTSSHSVTVEATPSKGDLVIIGLIDDALTRETRIRVRSALAQEGIDTRDVTVSIRQYNGGNTLLQAYGFISGLDLPIALAIAGVKGKSVPEENTFVFGELALDGRVRPVRGAYTHALQQCGPFIAPVGNQNELELSGVYVSVVATLGDALRGNCTRLYPPSESVHGITSDLDIADVKQASVRRALEIAAAGQHNILLMGPPGCGKVAAARRLASILPPLNASAACDVLSIYSAAGLAPRDVSGGVARSLRAPHYTVSAIGLIGGGITPRPGEVTLAHEGVLLLDEIPEFHREPLARLAQVLREREVLCRTTRTNVTRMPAGPTIVVGTANRCPCGYNGNGNNQCTCSAERIQHWRERLEACPIPFDLRVYMNADPMFESERGTESSKTVRARVKAAWGMHDKWMSSRPGELGFNTARVARTIAHLAGTPVVQPEHLAEAKTLTEEP